VLWRAEQGARIDSPSLGFGAGDAPDRSVWLAFDVRNGSAVRSHVVQLGYGSKAQRPEPNNK
jgi:hypothetical protein